MIHNQSRRRHEGKQGRARRRHRARVANDLEQQGHPAQAIAWRGVLAFSGAASPRNDMPRPRNEHGSGLSNRAREVFRGKVKRTLKRLALKHCGRRCVYCAEPLEMDRATLDHVHPVAYGGRHDPGNLVVACKGCNQLKGDMLPLEFFYLNPWAGLNFCRYARAAHRALKRGARRAVSLAFAEAA